MDLQLVLQMAAPAMAHPPLTPEKSLDDATHLVGELSSDGVASLWAEPISCPFSATGTESLQRTSAPHRPPQSTRDDSSGRSSVVSSGSTASWEDYDALEVDPATVVEGAKGGGFDREATLMNHEMEIPSPGLGMNKKHFEALKPLAINTDRPSYQRRKSISTRLEKTDKKGRYLLTADDPELREILRRGVERESQGVDVKRRSRFSDLVFTRQFTTFDRQNPTSAGSLFHGFFTLFWLGTALLLMKVAADNWKTYGSIFGRNEIMTMMFRRDVAVLGLTDGVMCASTCFCLLLQKAIVKGYVSWNKQGWIIQNVCMSLCNCVDSSAGNCLSMRYLGFVWITSADPFLEYAGLASLLSWCDHRLDNTQIMALDTYSLHSAPLSSDADETTFLCSFQRLS